MKVLFFIAGVVLLTARGDAKPQVVATQTLLADLVHEVGVGTVDVVCLLPANVDPHSYEPAPSDFRQLEAADLVVMNGLGLEPWAERLVGHSGFRGKIVRASDGCPLRLHLAGVAYSLNEYDPHAWHDVANVIHYVVVIRDALVQIAPDQSTTIKAQAAAYVKKLEQLDTYTRTQLATIPENRRKLVTSHDSLQYLARTYGLTIVPIAGSRPDQEPSPQEIARLITLIRDQRVTAVFFEPTSSPKLARLVAEDAHVSVVRELCTDGLGPPGSPTSTYLGMFRFNIDTIVAALR